MATFVLTLQTVSLTRCSKLLLDNITVNVKQGEIVIISGPSGAGKSSLLRLINRLDSPTSGKIIFKGRDIQDYSPSGLRQHVALVFQTSVMFPGSVLENFYMVERINNRPCQSESFYEEKLRQVGLPDLILKQDAVSLSLGEKQRFSVARTLINNPEIMLLDEPTSALDPEASAHLLNTVHELHHQSGITILMVTHKQHEGESIGTRFINLKEGKIVEDIPLRHHDYEEIN